MYSLTDFSNFAPKIDVNIQDNKKNISTGDVNASGGSNSTVIGINC